MLSSSETQSNASSERKLPPLLYKKNKKTKKLSIQITNNTSEYILSIKKTLHLVKWTTQRGFSTVHEMFTQILARNMALVGFINFFISVMLRTKCSLKQHIHLFKNYIIIIIAISCLSRPSSVTITDFHLLFYIDWLSISTGWTLHNMSPLEDAWC